jgi:hypothetical protein
MGGPIAGFTRQRLFLKFFLQSREGEIGKIARCRDEMFFVFNNLRGIAAITSIFFDPPIASKTLVLSNNQSGIAPKRVH